MSSILKELRGVAAALAFGAMVIIVTTIAQGNGELLLQLAC